jgi:hypothetical protein
LDTIVFGDEYSETAHMFASDHSEVIDGGLDQSARRLLPLTPATWKGGTMAFTMTVDPGKTNYVTIKLWGSEINENRLVLFAEGKQIGYLHSGDIDILDFGTNAPAYNNRFYYTTNPLPKSLTAGKSEIHLEIRSHGPTWGYGKSFERYQRTMEQPSRGIYRFYTHTNGFFAPPADEEQGLAPVNPPTREHPGVEVLDQVKASVNNNIVKRMGKESPNQTELEFLARAYHIEWTKAYHDPKVVEAVIRGGDAIYEQFQKDSAIAIQDRSTDNPGWFGLGPLGHALWLLADQIENRLDENISPGLTRRDAWTEMFIYSRDWNQQHRRLYTNQSMIKDLYGIYLTNRGLDAINPDQAAPQEKMLDYLYQSVGLIPWLGSDTPDGPEKPVGENYYELTDKGLTKELGYVGRYGEVLGWVTSIYDATRPALGEPGDPKIRRQLIKMLRARSHFRYPMLDADGYRAMRLETVVGWRNMKLPGDIVYAQLPTLDASALQMAVAVQDPDSIGFSQQMLEDNQFFVSVEHLLEAKTLRSVSGLLDVPGQYETITQLPVSGQRLPMSKGQPDGVFADEEVGVVAVKNGDDILYASLYWRARNAINFLARVHYLTPRLERIAITAEETEFEASGAYYTRSNFIDLGFGNGGHRYPEQWDSSLAGERLPIAKIPDGIGFTPGDESVYAGRGQFYRLHYGPYLIGMNCTTDKSFDLSLPDDFADTQVKNVGTGRMISTTRSLQVGPRSTLVLYRPSQE